MLQNAHQFAVSYPFVRCHDSLVVKKKILFIACKWRREEWKRKQKTCSQFATRLLPPPLHRIWLYCFCEQFWLHDRWQETSMFSSTPQMLIFLLTPVLQLQLFSLQIWPFAFDQYWQRQVRLVQSSLFDLLDFWIDQSISWGESEMVLKSSLNALLTGITWTLAILFYLCMLLGCFVAPRTPKESSILQRRHLILNINWIPIMCCHLFAPSL